jgi:hypothetical protein
MVVLLVALVILLVEIMVEMLRMEHLEETVVPTLVVEEEGMVKTMVQDHSLLLVSAVLVSSSLLTQRHKYCCISTI